MKRKALVLFVVVAISLALVGIVAAEMVETVTLKTDYAVDSLTVYFDWDGDGVAEADELLGTLPAYDWDNDLEFSWLPVEGATSYRVALQYLWPWAAEEGKPFSEWTGYSDIKVAHHWAENPNGTEFVMGSFGWVEGVCIECPHRVTVMPETFVKYLDLTTGTYEYAYTLMEGDTQVSSWFWLTNP